MTGWVREDGSKREELRGEPSPGITGTLQGSTHKETTLLPSFGCISLIVNASIIRIQLLQLFSAAWKTVTFQSPHFQHQVGTPEASTLLIWEATCVVRSSTSLAFKQLRLDFPVLIVQANLTLFYVHNTAFVSLENPNMMRKCKKLHFKHLECKTNLSMISILIKISVSKIYSKISFIIPLSS